MSRPYPLKCRSCGTKALVPVQSDYNASIEHDGRKYQFVVPCLNYLECTACYEKSLPHVALERVYEFLRVEAGLYQPRDIREKRLSLKLTQDELANFLNVAKETISRWEKGGQIQQRSSDLLLRLFFEIPQVRLYLERQKSTNGTMDTSASTDKSMSVHSTETVPTSNIIQ